MNQQMTSKMAMTEKIEALMVTKILQKLENRRRNLGYRLMMKIKATIPAMKEKVRIQRAKLWLFQIGNNQISNKNLT